MFPDCEREFLFKYFMLDCALIDKTFVKLKILFFMIVLGCNAILRVPSSFAYLGPSGESKAGLF